MANILIAEDEERIALFVAKGLKAAGYQTHVVGYGVSALQHASSGYYDLMVLDVAMPKKDGFTVLRVFRSLVHDILIIMVHARAAEGVTVAGREGGAHDT